MLLSLALVLLVGLTLGKIFSTLHLPSLLGMLIAGMILGPYVLNLIAPELIDISGDLRQVALVIILLRAGLTLNISALRRIGLPAVLLCFVPAIFEIGAIIIAAPVLLKIPIIDAALMGAVLAAVSPAVIVPRMIKIKTEGYGTKKSIPELIMAGAAVDDIFVIILFTALLSTYSGESLSIMTAIQVPMSILSGVGIGIICGYSLVKLFKRIHMQDSIKVIILIGIAFLLISIEHYFAEYISFSGLLAVMIIGIVILKDYSVLAIRLSTKFSKIWLGAEILLFVLVGIAVNINYLTFAGFSAITVILVALFARGLGVFVSLLSTPLTIREKLFCILSYMPKATVQAAIGSIPLSLGLQSGELILTMAVLSIIITAPLGALGIDKTYRKLL
ncbi:cation:proton antiporter [Culicoidibacter larvae]|uniref:Sodium:proton antiporter n=1 Tax=Culicoidibacter larvae TaxID=2579976 RepID=A0A5R8QG88_9FIRM|nr:cation:proton antiporter [Culicoidibacter larvae]TLG75503.1 sodium:proton antiporter [Culicoidibacter larvae]